MRSNSIILLLLVIILMSSCHRKLVQTVESYAPKSNLALATDNSNTLVDQDFTCQAVESSTLSTVLQKPTAHIKVYKTAKSQKLINKVQSIKNLDRKKKPISYSIPKKNKLVTGLLLFFLNPLNIHLLYIGRYKYAIIKYIIFLLLIAACIYLNAAGYFYTDSGWLSMDFTSLYIAFIFISVTEIFICIELLMLLSGKLDPKNGSYYENEQ